MAVLEFTPRRSNGTRQQGGLGEVDLSQVPPSNPDAEQSILSAILARPERLFEASETLPPDAFYSPSHKAIFEAMLDLFKQGKAVDLVTLGDSLKRRGQLDEAGGQVFLAELASGFAGNYSECVQIALDFMARRQVIQTGLAMIEAGHDLARDLGDVSKLTSKIKPVSTHSSPLRGIISAADLMDKDLPEVRWCVPNLLPEGLCVLAGNPKLGKSWLALALALSVGSGGRAFGKFDVPRGKALYLALEDSERRLQDRVRQIVGIDPGLGSGLANVELQTTWPTMDEGGLELLDRHAEANPDLRLIIVDTLVRLRPKTRPKGLNAYEVDSIHLAEIKALADRRNLCVLVVTHMNKTRGHDDPFSAITGSQGQFGAADTALLLVRGRGRADAELKATGRDIMSQDYAMNWEAPLWVIKGNAEDVAKTNERQAILDVLREAEEPMRPKEIAEAIGKRADAVRFLVGKLKKEGLVREAGYGKYLINTPHTTHTTHSASSAHSAHTRTWLEELDDRQV